MSTTCIPVGTICHGEDDHKDPTHRRVGIWLDGEGQMWADAAAPHVVHPDTFTSVEAARVAARKAWAGPEWAYRDSD